MLTLFLGSDEECLRYDIEQFSGRLSLYLDDGRREILDALRGEISSLLPDESVLEIQKRIKTHELKTIWVQGIPVMSYGTGVSHAAIRIRDISLATSLPCVSFFCKPLYGFVKEKVLKRREAGLVALLYSVIGRLACLLPTAFLVTNGLDEYYFSLLDGSMEGVPASLELIRVLLIDGPPALIWVIDGL